MHYLARLVGAALCGAGFAIILEARNRYPYLPLVDAVVEVLASDRG